MMIHSWLLALLAASYIALWGCSTAGNGRTVSGVEASTAPASTPSAPTPADAKAPPPFHAESASKRPPQPAAGKPPMTAGLTANEANEECLIDDDEVENQSALQKGKEPTLNRALYLCRSAQSHWKRGDLEKAIDTLDQAYALVLSVDPGNDPTLQQEKEDLRFTVSKRILEIYSSRRVVVNGNRNEIPLTINKHVQDEIDSFTIGRERDFFVDSMRRSGRYRAKIETALKEAGLPAELSWLPLIESGFKVTALSPARALGLWQFIPSTGYRYNLNRDTYIDERLDPEKATQGAIAYMKELHGMFGDWMTVLAAYNCGEHRVMRTIQSQNINYMDHFWDLYERLPRETARYVPRFLATLHIVQNLGKYGMGDLALDPPLRYETVEVPRQVSLKSVALTTGIDEGLLRELNAELRQGILPENGYDLRVPVGESALAAAKADDIPVYRPQPVVTPAVTVVTHKVRKGETLETIAKHYQTTAKNIMAANNLRRPAPVAVGASLRVPLACPPERPAPPQTAKSPPPPPPPKREPVEHVVRQGDSLFNIAKRYGTTTEDIQRLNKMTATGLSVGQVLKIPQTIPSSPPSKPEPPKPTRSVYAVRSGDTIQSIAKKHKMPLDRLLALNRLTTQSKLQAGQKLIIEN
jgi:membrane-bound lytic murein transglycosylase D